MSESFKKTVEYSRTEQVHIISHSDLNGGGRLFGGALIQMIDELAAIVAIRHSGYKNVTTASIDNLIFKSGAYLNDMIVLIGYVTYTGKTSMEIKVDTYIEKIDGMRYPMNRAYLTLVAIDESNKPAPIPQLIIENTQQQNEWHRAEQRRSLLLKRRKMGI